MLETFEIADSSSSAKDESTLEVAGAVGVEINWIEQDPRTDVLAEIAEDAPVVLIIDATWMELVEDSGTDVLAEDTPVVLIIEATWMELVEDPGTDALAEDTPVGLGLWKIVDITTSSVDVVKSPIEATYVV